MACLAAFLDKQVGTAVNFIGGIKVACAGESTIGAGNVEPVLGGTGLACEQHAVTGGEDYPVNLRGSVLQVDIGKGGHAGNGARGKRINIFLGGGVFGLSDRAINAHLVFKGGVVVPEFDVIPLEDGLHTSDTVE